MILIQDIDPRFLLIGCVTILTVLLSTEVDGAADVIINIDQYIPCQEGQTNMNFKNIMLNKAPNNNINVSFELEILKTMPSPVIIDATIAFKARKDSPGPFIHLMANTQKDICPSLEKPESTMANVMDILGLGGERCPIQAGRYDRKNKVLEIPEKVRDLLAAQEYWKITALFKKGKEKDSEVYMCVDLYFKTEKISQKKKGYGGKFGG